MISTLEKILHDGIIPHDAPLHHNAYASRLLEFIHDKKKVPDSEWRLTLLYQDEKPEINTADSSGDFDARIKCLLLKNVRQYCMRDKPVDFYSLDFTDDNLCASAVIHGANGSGKTTLYAALEYLYLGRSKIAEAHGYSLDDDALEYFRSIDSRKDEIDLKATILCGQTSFKNRQDLFEIPASFCSECDYFEISREWRNLNRYIAYEMGYGELQDILQKINHQKSLLTLSIEFRNYNTQIIEINKKLKGQLPLEEIKLLQSQRDKIILMKSSTRKKFMELRGSAYKKGINQFALDNKKNPISDIKISELINTLDYLRTEWQKILEEFKTMAVPVFNALMMNYLKEKEERLQFDVNGNEIEVSLIAKISSDNMSEEKKQPIEYFNTFRLKLFCIAFKMSLYCYAKKKHKLNLPFIIDDIFDSSDFCNRSKIGTFIKSMIKSHDTIFNGNDNFPIQIIFFTQDNLIGENIFRGIRNYIRDLGKEKTLKVIYKRLFRPDDCNADSVVNDVRDYTLNGANVKTFNISDPLS